MVRLAGQHGARERSWDEKLIGYHWPSPRLADAALKSDRTSESKGTEQDKKEPRNDSWVKPKFIK